MFQASNSCRIFITTKTLVRLILQINVVVLIFTFQMETKSRSVFNLLFLSQYLLTEDYMRQREVWAAVNIQR